MSASDELIALLDKRCPRYSDSSARLGFEQRWMAQLAFFAGRQYITVLGNSIQDMPRRDQNEIRYIANFIKPAVLRAVTKVMQVQGRFGVCPDKNTADARRAGAMSEQVRDHWIAQSGFRYEKMMALMWAAICGTGFLKVIFDPKKGENQRYYRLSKTDSTAILGKYLDPDERMQKNREGLFDDAPSGEVEVEAVMPFQIYPDPISKGKIENCRWLVQQQYIDRDWVAETYNVNASDLEPEESINSAQRFEDAIALMGSGMDNQTWAFSSADNDLRNRVRLRQCWERPSSKSKKGRFMVVAGKKVLLDSENRLTADESGWSNIPFVVQPWIPMPGRFWGLSLVEDLQSIQVRRNESRARLSEFENVFGRPPTIVPKGAGLGKDGFVMKSGAVYESNMQPGVTPIFVPQPTLPPEVFANSETALSEMRYISSQSDVDSSKMPGQIRSGSGLAALQRDRDMVLDVTIFASLAADRDVGRMMLGQAKVFYDDERLVAMRGSNGEWAVRAFRAADLRNDVRILGEPGEYETSNQYQAKVMDMLNAGALNPAANPEDRQVMLKAMKFKTAEELVTDYTQHEEAQEYENEAMLGNPAAYMQVPFPVMPYEDDAAHQRVLERLFNNREEFAELDPATKSVLVAHWKAHEDQKQAKMQAQLAALEAQKGAPGQKGVASQARQPA